METKTYRLDNLFRLSKVEYLLQFMLLGGSTPLTDGSLRVGFINHGPVETPPQRNQQPVTGS
jgi:hypothetical protein